MYEMIQVIAITPDITMEATVIIFNLEKLFSIVLNDLIVFSIAILILV